MEVSKGNVNDYYNKAEVALVSSYIVLHVIQTFISPKA